MCYTYITLRTKDINIISHDAHILYIIDIYISVMLTLVLKKLKIFYTQSHICLFHEY